MSIVGSTRSGESGESALELQVDIVSDVVCPWCIIGYKQFERALATATQPLHATVRWQPFELNPNMPEDGQNLREHLAQKAGITPEQSRDARQRLSSIGDSLGFTFNFQDEMRVGNTFRAHQLLHWAEGQGLQTALKLALFKAYFSDGCNVNDIDVLASTAASAGLPESEARAVMEEGRYAEAVRGAEQQWLERDIRGVPAFIFNHNSDNGGKRSYAVLGAQGPEAFQRVFDKIAD